MLVLDDVNGPLVRNDAIFVSNCVVIVRIIIKVIKNLYVHTYVYVFKHK